MTTTKLTEVQLAEIRPLEAKLKSAVTRADCDEALNLATKIQDLFPEDRSHLRLLKAKLLAFEACIDANRLPYAESGIIGVRNRAGKGTRLALEAGALLAVALLRQKKQEAAKPIISEIIANINSITSESKRRQFQRRFLERMEEECVLGELIGSGEGRLDPVAIDKEAIFLIQRKDEDEIFTIIGKSVPDAIYQRLIETRNLSLLQISGPDRKFLTPPIKPEDSRNLGKMTFLAIRRIAWKTFCKPSSPIYKLWSNRVPKVFNEGYFSAAIVTALSDFRIGLPLLASGLTALIMKYSAEEFCDLAKPKGLIISPKDRD